MQVVGQILRSRKKTPLLQLKQRLIAGRVVFFFVLERNNWGEESQRSTTKIAL